MGTLIAVIIATFTIYCVTRLISVISSFNSWEKAGKEMAKVRTPPEHLNPRRSREMRPSQAPNIATTPVIRLSGEFDEQDTYWNVLCEFRKFEDSPFRKDSLGVYEYEDLESAKETALHYKYTPQHWRNIQIVQMRKEDEFSDE
jgi:hypothetical protein